MADNQTTQDSGVSDAQSFFKIASRGGERPDFLRDIAEFHERFGLFYHGKPRILPADLADFRVKFMREELEEWADAQREASDSPDDPSMFDTPIEDTLELQLDSVVDLMYVALGTIYMQGLTLQFEEAWRRVHEANMRKVRKLRATDGHQDSGRAAQYDVVKPAGWEPPRHIDLVSDHAHK